jgi:hypothetical protein
MHSDFPSVLPVKDHRAFGTYRSPLPAPGTASLFEFALRHASPGAYPKLHDGRPVFAEPP